jgi:uncharacterized protein YbbC (DUF1343 family)
LLEASNVSEGRGSEAPFLLFGAPWLIPGAVATAVDASRWGFRLEEATFVPAAAPGTRKPKHEGQACRGFRVRVEDPGKARPYAFGVALLVALRRQEPFTWSEQGEALDRLVGSRRLRAGLESGLSVEAILAADEEAIRSFRRERSRALLY